MASRRRARGPWDDWAETIDYQAVVTALLDIHRRGRKQRKRGQRTTDQYPDADGDNPEVSREIVAEIAEALAVAVWFDLDGALGKFHDAARTVSIVMEERIRLDRGPSAESRSFGATLREEVHEMLRVDRRDQDPVDDALIESIARLCALRIEDVCVLPEGVSGSVEEAVTGAVCRLRKRRSNADAIVLTALRAVGVHDPNLLKAGAMARLRADPKRAAAKRRGSRDR